MVAYLTHTEPLLWVDIQDSSDQVLALARQELWQSVVCAHNFLVKVGSFWILKR
jgi:hypothetical protein